MSSNAPTKCGEAKQTSEVGVVAVELLEQTARDLADRVGRAPGAATEAAA